MNDNNDNNDIELFSPAKDATFQPAFSADACDNCYTFFRTNNASGKPGPRALYAYQIIKPPKDYVYDLTNPGVRMSFLKSYFLNQLEQDVKTARRPYGPNENNILQYLLPWCPEHNRHFFTPFDKQPYTLPDDHVKLYEPLGKFLSHLAHTGVKIESAPAGLLSSPRLFDQESPYFLESRFGSPNLFHVSESMMSRRNRECASYYHHFNVESPVNFPFIKNFEKQLKDKGWTHEMLLIMTRYKENFFCKNYSLPNLSSYILHRFIDPKRSIVYAYVTSLRISPDYEGLYDGSLSDLTVNAAYDFLANNMLRKFNLFRTPSVMAKLSPSLAGSVKDVPKRIFELQPTPPTSPIDTKHSILFLPAPNNPNEPSCTPLSFTMFLCAGNYSPKVHFNFRRHKAKALWNFWYTGLTSIKAWDDDAPFEENNLSKFIYLPPVAPEEEKIRGFIDQVVLHKNRYD